MVNTEGNKKEIDNEIFHKRVIEINHFLDKFLIEVV